MRVGGRERERLLEGGREGGRQMQKGERRLGDIINLQFGCPQSSCVGRKRGRGAEEREDQFK